MSLPAEFLSKMESILGASMSHGVIKLSLHWDTEEEAKHHLKTIRLMQSQLRLLKKDINAHTKQIRSAFSTRKAQVGKGFGSAFAGGLLGKKTVGKANTLERDRLRREQNNAVAPYEKVARIVDEALLQLDRLKLQLDQWIIDNEAN